MAGTKKMKIFDLYGPKGDKGDKGDPGGLGFVYFTEENGRLYAVTSDDNTAIRFNIKENGCMEVIYT